MLKQVESFFCLKNEFFTYILVLIGIYIAQTFFKISKVRKTGEFDWKELVNGIIDYALYFVGIIVFFFAGTLIPDKEMISFEDKTYSITSLLTVIMYGLIVAQASKCFKNIMETFNIKKENLLRTQAEIIEREVV